MAFEFLNSITDNRPPSIPEIKETLLLLLTLPEEELVKIAYDDCYPISIRQISKVLCGKTEAALELILEILKFVTNMKESQIEGPPIIKINLDPKIINSAPDN